MQYTARMKVTYSTLVSVEADSREEAEAKLKAGNWTETRTDEATDWGDPREIVCDDNDDHDVHHKTPRRRKP